MASWAGKSYSMMKIIAIRTLGYGYPYNGGFEPRLEGIE
jgi:hypothetical protein